MKSLSNKDKFLLLQEAREAAKERREQKAYEERLSWRIHKIKSVHS